MGKLANSIIGEYFADGYVEAIMKREHAIGPSLRVCIRVRGRADSLEAISHADTCLPKLVADMTTAEALAIKAAASAIPATMFDIWVERDGAVSYTCGFLDGEEDGALVVVQRKKDGELTLA